MTERRRTYVPTLILGAAATGLGVLAASNAWVSGQSGTLTGESLAEMGTDVTRSPLASALALVALATWGVVLVTRGWFRRLITVTGALASIGYAVVVAVEPRRMLDSLADALSSGHGATDTVMTDPTGWVVVAAVAAVGMVVASVAAVVLVPSWPQMGTRYDAPGDANSRQRDPEGNLDMWKALDDGHDPTA